MSEIILGLIILTLLGGFGWYVKEQGKERTRLITAILSKDTQEYVNRTLAENTKITPEINKSDLDLIPMDQLDEESFDKHIQAVLNNQVVDQEIN